MGERLALDAGWSPEVVGTPRRVTRAADTREAAEKMVERGIELLIFAGGDGTAVDLLAAVGDGVPVIGIPAGVKMHSAVFTVSPAIAGRVAELFFSTDTRDTVNAEVADLDEGAARRGIVSPRLHGTLRVPAADRLMQSPKVRSVDSDGAALADLAEAFRESMVHGVTYVIGPGSTTSALLHRLGLAHTLLGVDVVRDGRVIAADVDDTQLTRLVRQASEVRIVVTPIGGQGFLFGRGNQQIAPAVIARAGRDGVIVVATESKLATLLGRPLLVDTGRSRVDVMVAGRRYIRVLLGTGRTAMYPVQRADETAFDGVSENT
jgi:predicted polyphosphate/ATP-dependent NAD kinase